MNAAGICQAMQEYCRAIWGRERVAGLYLCASTPVCHFPLTLWWGLMQLGHTIHCLLPLLLAPRVSPYPQYWYLPSWNPLLGIMPCLPVERLIHTKCPGEWSHDSPHALKGDGKMNTTDDLCFHKFCNSIWDHGAWVTPGVKPADPQTRDLEPSRHMPFHPHLISHKIRPYL